MLISYSLNNDDLRYFFATKCLILLSVCLKTFRGLYSTAMCSSVVCSNFTCSTVCLFKKNTALSTSGLSSVPGFNDKIYGINEFINEIQRGLLRYIRNLYKLI